MTQERVIARLEEIASRPGFAYMLAILVRRELFVDPAQLADTNWRERLSYQELTLLIGLMVKHALLLDLPSEENTFASLNEITQLFEELHNIYNMPLMETMKGMLGGVEGQSTTVPDEKYVEDIFASGEVMAEPIFYGAIGAYDFQFTTLASKRYADDETWLKANKGFSLVDIADVPIRLKKLTEQRNQSHSTPSNFEEFCRNSLRTFTFSRSDIGVRSDAVDAFLKEFSLEPGKVNSHFQSVGQYNAVASHPLICLGDDLFFLPIHFLLAQSLYESPFYWMILDRKYKATAAKNRGSATENCAFEMLLPVFGADLLRNVTIKKTKGETITDIDLLAVVGNKAIVFQAKSKRLTELSRRGNTAKLKEDFAGAVQDAYDQGLICRNAILTRQSKLYDSDGNPIALSEEIDEAYIVCLTSDDYPGLAAQVDTYLQKPIGAPAPVAMGIFDLEIVAFYLRERFEFLYYIRQRVALADYFTTSSEMALLGFHLRQKLFRMKEYDRGYVDDQFAQLIDASYPSLMGRQRQTDAAERLRPKWRNEKFDKLVREIQEADEPGLTDAVFYLYDLTSRGADDLVRHIEAALDRSRRTGSNTDFSLIFEKGMSGVSFIAHVGDAETFPSAVMIHGEARKYKTRANTWLALGSLAGSSRMVDMVAFSKAPWRHDTRLEQVARLALKPGMAVGHRGRKFGRNAPCVCGSGKKFKKCCGVR